MSIEIVMKDGTVRKFPHEGRSGGSYTKSIRYEPGFVVIKDEYYNETIIPSELIAEIKTTQERY